MSRKRCISISDFAPSVQEQIKAQIGKTKRHKYSVSNPSERTSDGVVFDSKWEMRVYHWLKSNLHPSVAIIRQPRFVLQESQGKLRPITLIADFVVGCTASEFSAAEDIPPGALVIDAKGMETDVFKLKRKMFRYRYGIDIFTPKSMRDLSKIPWGDLIRNELRKH